MAFSVTAVEQNFSSTGASSYTTGMASPPANSLQLLAVASLRNAGLGNFPTVTGAGATWTRIASETGLGGTANPTRIDLYVAQEASYPAGSALTISYAGQSQTEIGWCWSYVTGCLIDLPSKGRGAVAQVGTASVINATTIGGGTLFPNVMSPGSLAWGSAFLNSDTDPLANGAGYTDNGFWTQPLFGQQDCQYDTTNPPRRCDWSWTDNTLDATMAAVEVLPAGTAESTLPGDTAIGAPGEWTRRPGGPDRFGMVLGHEFRPVGGVATGTAAPPVIPPPAFLITPGSEDVVQEVPALFPPPPVTVTPGIPPPPGPKCTITAQQALSGSSTATQTTFTTATYTPTPNTLAVLAVIEQGVGGNDAQSPAVSGAGLTWVESPSGGIYAQFNRRLSLFYAVVGASPSSGALTLDYTTSPGGAHNVGWSLTEFAGVDSTSPFVQSSGHLDGSATTSITETLAGFTDANDVAFGAFYIQGGSTPTPGSGFAQLADVQIPSSDQLLTEWKTNDNTVDASYSSQTNVAVVAAELRAGTGPCSSFPFKQWAKLVTAAPVVPQPPQQATVALGLTPGTPPVTFYVAQAVTPEPNLPQPPPQVTISQPGLDPSKAETVPVPDLVQVAAIPQPLQPVTVGPGPNDQLLPLRTPLSRRLDIVPVGQAVQAVEISQAPNEQMLAPLTPEAHAVAVGVQAIAQPLQAASVYYALTPGTPPGAPRPWSQLITPTLTAPPQPLQTVEVAYALTPGTPPPVYTPGAQQLSIQPIPQSPPRVTVTTPGLDPRRVETVPVPGGQVEPTPSIPLTVQNASVLLGAPDPRAAETVPLATLIESQPFGQPPPATSVTTGFRVVVPSIAPPGFRPVTKPTENIAQPPPPVRVWINLRPGIPPPVPASAPPAEPCVTGTSYLACRVPVGGTRTITCASPVGGRTTIPRP